MMGLFRLRNLVLFGIGALVVAAYYLTDPDKGLGAEMFALTMLGGVVIVALSFLMRKALHDYPEADIQSLFKKAGESPTGSGLALIAYAIIFSAILTMFAGRAHAQSVQTYIPALAKVYAPMLKAEQVKFWGDHPAPEYLAGLVEQESCISLTHSKCWSPKAQLKTVREEGAGVGQITRAYDKRGRLRFDSLTDMSRRYADLKGWTWANVYSKPEYQFRAIVLMSRDNYVPLHRLVADKTNALAFADAAYNGGKSGVDADRRACGLKLGCDPQKWFGHVENTCMKSHGAIYGKRSACTINREHVANVMLKRSAKYRGLMT